MRSKLKVPNAIETSHSDLITAIGPTGILSVNFHMIPYNRAPWARTNKYTKQFTKEFLIDSESIDNAIQKTIAIGGIDPLNFDIKVEEASMSQAQGWLEEKFPNGDFKHLVVDGENGVYELIYNPMGNIY